MDDLFDAYYGGEGVGKGPGLGGVPSQYSSTEHTHHIPRPSGGPPPPNLRRQPAESLSYNSFDAGSLRGGEVERNSFDAGRGERNSFDAGRGTTRWVY